MPPLLEKIRVLGAAGKYDICASSGCASNSRVSNKPLRKTYIKEEEKNSYFGSTLSSGICHSFTPDGRCVSLFKVLFSNACIFNCKYCFNKVNRRKMSLTPEEYARAFMHLYLGNYVEGMFLSSGITKNADVTMEKMLQAVILLREKHNFRGYIHFKCLPGASRDIIKRAAQYVDRMSINLESPTQNHLSEIADQKTLKTDILRRQEWIRDMSEKNFSDWEKIDRIQSFDTRLHNKISNQTCEVKYNQAKQLPAGQTTQFVVGAADETDWDILNRLNWEYKSIKLRRGYFSSFYPIIGTPLEKKPATPLLREHRLYQTDWLMRIYKIPLKEIKNILTDDLYLPRTDPKIKLAKNYFDGIKPNDINNLPYSELLRIPGIGLTSARRIMKLRNEGIKITKKIQLKNIGVVLKRAEPYIKFGNSYQSTLEAFIS